MKFAWEVEPEPILKRGGPGEFDSVDIRNPAVRGNRVYYSGFDGKTWHTGWADDMQVDGNGTYLTARGMFLSPDAATWEANQLAIGNGWLMDSGRVLFYHAGRPAQIAWVEQYNPTPDVPHFNRQQPVLTPGPAGSWDEAGVSDPCVIEEPIPRGNYYLYYTGTDRTGRRRIGVARSYRDPGQWEKHPGNPVLSTGAAGEFDENGVSSPAVWQSHGRYWMLYTGGASGERHAIGLVESMDGVNWKRSQTVPPLRGTPGTWMSQVVRDPAVNGLQLRETAILVWFAGGNRLGTNGVSNGAIGLATLRLLYGQSY